MASVDLLQAVIGGPHLRPERGQSPLPNLAVEFGASKHSGLHRSHLGIDSMSDR